MKIHLFLALACAVGLSPAANAAIVIDHTETVEAAGGAPGQAYTPALAAPSTTDILTGITPTFSGSDTVSGTGTMSVLTDGSIANFWGDGTEDNYHLSYIGGGDSQGHVNDATYALGGAFDLTEIVIYGGWGDAGRDDQDVDISVSSDGTTFTSIGATLLGALGSADGPINHRNSITDDSGIIATGVTHLHFAFSNAVANGWSGYTEIDVEGVVVNIPGDADKNGVVNILDFYMISDNFLSVPSIIGDDGDVNFDNFVDQKDFRLWRTESGNATAASAAIPEPASIVIAGICAAMGLGAVRCRS